MVYPFLDGSASPMKRNKRTQESHLYISHSVSRSEGFQLFSNADNNELLRLTSTYRCFVAGDCYCSPVASGDDLRSGPAIQLNPPSCSQVQLAPTFNAGDSDSSGRINTTRCSRGLVEVAVVVAIVVAVVGPVFGVAFVSSLRIVPICHLQ